MAIATHIFSDASVNRKRGMGFSWVAVQGDKVIAKGGGRIPTSENPDFGSTTAEAIGLLSAYKATADLPNRQFFCDSESLATLTRTRKPSGNQLLAKLVQCIPVNVQFNNQSPFIHMVDSQSKRSHVFDSVRISDLLDFGITP